MQLVPINCMLSCLIINPTTPFKSVNTPTLIVHFDELAISGIGFQALSTRWVKGTVSLVNADDSVKLPGGYADQYRAWRPAEAVDPFTEVNETVYATGTVNLRSGPSTAHDKVGSLNKSDSVTRVGIGTAEAEGWSRIQLSDGSLVYVSNKYLSTTKPAPQQQQTSKPSGGQQSKPSGGQQSKPSESTQQQQTQQTETPPSDDGWVDPLQRVKDLESQGYATSGGNNTYSDAEREALGKILSGG